MRTPYLRATAQGTELLVHVQPGATRTEIVGEHGDALKIRITARAVDGAANAALVDFVADTLGAPRRGVRIVRGEKTRRKVLALAMPMAQAERQMADILKRRTTSVAGE